ncbi:MAG TPA: GH3 auxin-responsive promoter family protein, partial [Phycisphaerae bacterium]|nr:GH3 auxin-responsive promoter family protein [Phycisphaerae bacterium]
MGIGRTILRPVAFVAGLGASGQANGFFRAHRRTREVQARLLAELIGRHAETAFGRDHGFDRIRSYEDFKAAVPVGSYETLRPYMQRVLSGETDALLPAGERVLMFSLTSGTTGEPKHIPVTRRFLADVRRGWNAFGITVLRDHPESWLRPILQISSPMQETTTRAGVPCGAISGLLAATQKRIVRRMYVVPPGVFAIADPIARYYTILRCGIGRDVGIITTANPSSTIKLVETGQAHAERLIRDVSDGTLNPPGDVDGRLAGALRFKPDRRLAARLAEGLRRDGCLLPRHFWNLAFLTNWLGGTLRLYVPRLRELFGEVPMRDIGLLASEGRLSIPIADGTAAGVAEITSNFLEFIPAEQRERDNPPALRAEEVEVGREYLVVLSNWAGLWRYNIDDRVRVVDRFGQSPVFEFLCRGLHTASITGEKLTEHQVVEAMRRASSRAGLAVERFV